MTPLNKFLMAIMLAAPALAAPAMDPRQLAGEGAALDSIFTDTDNGVGYGVENAENHIAENLGGQPASGGGSTGGPPPPPPHMPKKRQGDKIANGASAILGALHQDVAANAVKTYGDGVDGELTSGAANAGAEIGGEEESTLEGAGNDVP